MDNVRGLVVGFITALAAYLNPLYGEIQSLLFIFCANFVFGLLADLLTENGSFSFKKAWQAVIQATCFVVLVCGIFFIGDKKGQPQGALQCVSFVTYAILYFYGCNILRNLQVLMPSGSVGNRAIGFLYYVISVEFVKNIPFLSNYVNRRSNEEVAG